MSSDHERESNRKVHIEQTATQSAQANTQREQDKTRTEQAATGANQAATQIEQNNTWTTERALRASELSYRRLFEAAQDGILILAVDTGRITDVNPFLMKLLGFSHAEMIGKTVGELSPFKDIEENKVMLERLQKFGYVRYEDLPLETRDGRHIAVEFVCNVYQAGEKKVIQCNVRDITARKRAEASLNRLASIIEFSDDAIIGKDLNSIITSWNRGAERIFGYPAAEMVGVSILRLIPADRQDEETQILAKIQNGKSIDHFETLRQTKDGRLIDISVTISPIKDAAGKVIGVSKVARDISERKLAEASLRETQARLKSTLAAGSIGTWTWDIVNDRLVADEFTAGLFSIETDAAAKGLPAEAYLQSVFEKDRPGVADGLARAIKSCSHYDIEYRVRQKSGELFWLQARGRVECDGSGKALYFHGAVMDITERKRTDGRFRRLVDSNVQGIVFWNTKGAITGGNDEFLRIVGYTREDLETGRISWAAMTPPEYAHLDRRGLEKLASNGVCTPFEKEYIRKDGSRVPILLGSAIFEDCLDEGVCFLLDITERRRTEQALRESEEHFHFLNDLSEATRTLADPVLIMAVMARMLGEHLHASRCAYADVAPDGEHFTILHDYTDGCASTVGKYQLSLFGPRAVATLNRGQTLIIRNVEAELLPGEGADTFKAIGIQAIITCPLVKDGLLRAMMAVHQTTPRGWKPGEITMVQDVVERCWATIERRAAEEKIRQLNVDLEHRVAERTAQLEVANRELEAFSYSVSHDLRAPLRHITGFVNLLEKDAGPSLSAKNTQYLTTISESAKRMGNLIDDLLSFSRVGRDMLQKTNINLDELLRAVLDEFEIELKERNIVWEIHPLPPVRADHSLLRLALINLISNAVKFTSHRAEAKIEIGCLPNEQGESVIFVRDNGAGFDSQYGHKLFGVFQRLHSHAEFEGTGIGLANVQRIIQRHGGRVWAEGAVDRGATFYLAIPKPDGAGPKD